MTLKYLIAPGRVKSTVDGDDHYIGASALMSLYGVSSSECAIWDYEKDYQQQKWKLELVRLGPRKDGNYTLPEPKVELPNPVRVWPFPTVHGNIPD